MTVFNDFHKGVYDDRMAWLRFLHHWCGGEDIFIRESAFPGRRVCHSIQQIHQQLLYFSDPAHQPEPRDIYLSIYSFGAVERVKAGPQTRERPVYSTAKLDVVAWDIDVPDGKDLRTAYEWARTMQHFLGGSDVALMVFSGRKGFHLYCSSDMIKHGEGTVLTAQAIRAFAMWVAEQCGVPLKRKKEEAGADVSVMGDAARVIRLPWTPHPKSGLFAVPVGQFDSLGEVLDRATRYTKPSPLFDFRRTPGRLDHIIEYKGVT